MGDSTTTGGRDSETPERADRDNSGGESESAGVETEIHSESVVDPNDSESDYLEPADQLNQHEIQIIEGNKTGSQWLVIDGAYVCHVNAVSVEGNITYCECKRRRHDR